MSVTAKNYYRRSLPESCIDFSSEQGKRLFTESLLEGNANIYFKLASQFRTQDEPAYCGLSTLVMVLNALEVDPERVWKAPWRFYHESMLDCCVPLENVKRSGINLVQFGCLSICNRLDTIVHNARETEEFLTKLRQDVISSVRGESTIIVAAYDRAVLGQTGQGHFSPIGAYHSASDSILIMDVARFKYPPHWVSLNLLKSAMCSIDRSTKETRGYTQLSLQKNSRPLVMFGIKCNLGYNDSAFASSVLAWKEFLLCDPLEKADEELYLCCRRFAQCFSPHALCCTKKNLDEEKEKTNLQCCTSEFSEACQIVCSEIKQTRVAKIFQNGAVAALMIAWPYQSGYSERCERLYNLTKHEISTFSIDTQNEIAILSTQLRTMISCNKPPITLEQILNKCQKPQQDCRCKQDVHL